MGRADSDILEIKLFDSSFQLFYKGKARVKDRKEMAKLIEDLNVKGVNISNSGWFG